MVTLDDCDLDEVSGGVSDEQPVARRRLHDLVSGHKLAGDHAQDADMSRGTAHCEAAVGQRADVHCLADPFRDLDRPVYRLRAALQNHLRPEGAQVVQNDDVRLVAGRDRAEVGEAVVLGRM